MSGKRCCTCGEAKEVEAFSRNRSTRDGLDYRCKACKRRYYEENHEAILGRSRRYRKENREAISEYKSRYYDENHKAERERQRRYREKNREAILGGQRRYREKNRDMARESATRTGEPYAPAEDAHILTSDEPVAVIAVELGRTMASVNNRRRILRKKAAA